MLPLGGLLAGLSWHAPFLVYLSALLIVPFALSAVRDVPRPRSPAPAPGTVPAQAPAVWPVYLLAFVTMLAFYMGPTQVPFVLAAVGVSPASMGLMIAISALAGGLTSLMYARLRARLTVGTLAALGLALLGAAWVLVGTADSLWQIVLGLLVNGVASGVLLPNFAVWLSALATPETRGRLLGGLTTAIFLGQFVSPLAAQPLVAIWDLSGAFVAVGLATMTLGGFMALRNARTVGRGEMNARQGARRRRRPTFRAGAREFEAHRRVPSGVCSRSPDAARRLLPYAVRHAGQQQQSSGGRDPGKRGEAPLRVLRLGRAGAARPDSLLSGGPQRRVQPEVPAPHAVGAHQGRGAVRRHGASVARDRRADEPGTSG
jgi:hypothetical protein